jgi:uncharacterized protein YacL
MLINLIRVLLLVVCIAVGRQIIPELGFENIDAVHGMIIGAAVAIVVICLERSLRGASVKELGIAASGLIVGLVAANLLSAPFYLIQIGQEQRFIVPIGLNILLGYLGVVMSLQRKKDLTMLPFWRMGKANGGKVRLIDTNVIIDGRISDIAKAGFLGGNLVIPRFVLRELHAIADCPDSLKRKRGRRGLEILNKLRKDPRINITIQDTDFPEVSDVDNKLVKLAKLVDGDIVTNDFNLNKVAELEGVRVLNINELANATKPVVLPGEVMSVKIAKEGKEPNQGVGYLDDGTMIVVENARRSTGLNVDVVVSSVLQTAAGKMIFARLRGANERI